MYKNQIVHLNIHTLNERKPSGGLTLNPPKDSGAGSIDSKISMLLGYPDIVNASYMIIGKSGLSYIVKPVKDEISEKIMDVVLPMRLFVKNPVPGYWPTLILLPDEIESSEQIRALILGS